MAGTDAFGHLIIEDGDTTPVRAWAILEFGKINPARVFLKREDAITNATLLLDGADSVVAVLVTGDKIEKI